ncbi:TorD/DmsD family molecular chaperone [Noviherbaspirillum massiliense]|uniref:TorD/DmsD family molecular chaperone n=1 Tax=Noviherbaspirillum massiliense TaxID=1465823 RepID=UPI0002F95247|nr:molecular chaperone TorD family protein [Noviherbaspirillum massiliense]
MNASGLEMPSSQTLLPPLAPEEQARADLYALIASLLLTPPDAQLLASLAQADSLSSQQSDNPLDLAWEKLVAAAAVVDEYAVREEFDALFVSVSKPQVNPYASLYLAGFMMEKPLAELRDDLAKLGLRRREGVRELEDHLAALCETMRVLITGGQAGDRQTLECQKAFFEKHIAPWYERCLHDIRSAGGANFYLHVASLIQAFFEIELQAFDIEEACPVE